MDVVDAVTLFVAHSKQLCEALHADGQKVSDIDLHKLRAQLHVLEIETSNLQTCKNLNLSDNLTLDLSETT
jgi:hypothetical protein